MIWAIYNAIQVVNHFSSGMQILLCTSQKHPIEWLCETNLSNHCKETRPNVPTFFCSEISETEPFPKKSSFQPLAAVDGGLLSALWQQTSADPRMRAPLHQAAVVQS